MQIVIAIAILGGLGLVFGLVLAAASKIFYVESDPRLDQLNECLPRRKLWRLRLCRLWRLRRGRSQGRSAHRRAASGGNEAAQAMAAIMGVKAEAVTRKVALVRCSGEKIYDADGNLTKGAKIKGNYEGLKDCLAASRSAATALCPASSAVWATAPASRRVNTAR